ncbi:hypothetical protein Adt_39567 [Abeliophyllum distichum]|uniref:Uncharacterized protein n=1 Tax=Abeliophyllum distichum TaxID=126358 RepID=A0ABD1Q9P5_9LAMI
MGDSNRKHPNEPDQPTMPPDLAPLLVGHISPATTNPNTGLTPLQSRPYAAHKPPNRGNPRVLPTTSGPFVLANSPPIADVPYSASLTSSQLIVPATDQPLPRADGLRTHIPAPQAPSGASNQQAIGGVPGFVGLPLNQMIEPKYGA